MKNKIYLIFFIFFSTFLFFPGVARAEFLYCVAEYYDQNQAYGGQGRPYDGPEVFAGFGYDSSTSQNSPAGGTVDWGDGNVDYLETGRDSPIQNNEFYHTYTRAGTYTVNLDAVVLDHPWLDCNDSFKVTVNVYGCTNPMADNYNSDASEDDGSCVFTQPIGWYNLNFNVRDQNNSPRRDALVTIGQSFGNGTTRRTDGSGFANFGIPQNNNVTYIVSDSGCTTVNGSRNVGTADETVNVSMNCTTDDGGGTPPNPGPQPAVGMVESANCTAITGAAGDPDNWGVEIGVYLFSGNTYQAGGTYVADVMTNIYRADINANFGITGNHGFSIPYPDSLRDNVARNFYVHPRDLGDTGPFTRLYYPSWGVNNVITLQCPPLVTPPVINNVSISSPTVIPNGTNQYTITHSATDAGGGSTIGQQYALINYMGTNAGQYKGYLTWAGFSWTGHKDNMMCDGNGDNVPDASGGYAAIQSINGNSTFGHDNIELDSCSTTISGNDRTTRFVVRFNPAFTTPLDYNSIAGFVYSTDGNYGWDNFANFGLNMPSLDSATISPSPVTANNTNHTITIVGDDPSGGANITHEYALINLTGSNIGQHRGYVSWYYDAAYTEWDALKNKMSCAGGGIAAIQSGYGDTYMTLISCNTSFVGNKRTTSFVVRFDPSFTTPTTSNLINAYIHNTFGHNTGWVNGSLFDLNVTAAPTVILPTVSAITTTGATLGATVQTIGSPVPLTARGVCYSSTAPTPSLTSGSTTCVSATLSQSAPQPFSVAVSGLTPGTPYNFRGYATNSTGTRYTTPTSTFTTSVAATPTLSASPLTATAGSGSISANFQNIPTPNSLDWIAVYPVGVADQATPPAVNYTDWVWASDCTRTSSTAAPGRVNGTCSNLAVPSSAGNYELRMFSSNGWGGWPAKLTSLPIVVSGVTPQNTLNVTANPGPGGTISGAGINCGSIVNVDCSESVPSGTVVRLTAVPASSYWKFNGWGGACSGTSTICDVTVSSNPTTVTASFVPRSFIYREF